MEGTEKERRSFLPRLPFHRTLTIMIRPMKKVSIELNGCQSEILGLNGRTLIMGRQSAHGTPGLPPQGHLILGQTHRSAPTSWETQASRAALCGRPRREFNRPWGPGWKPIPQRCKGGDQDRMYPAARSWYAATCSRSQVLSRPSSLAITSATLGAIAMLALAFKSNARVRRDRKSSTVRAIS